MSNLKEFKAGHVYRVCPYLHQSLQYVIEVLEVLKDLSRDNIYNFSQALKTKEYTLDGVFMRQETTRYIIASFVDITDEWYIKKDIKEMIEGVSNE